MHWLPWFVLLLHTVVQSQSNEQYRPCSELSRELRFPCTCALGPIETTLDGNPSISVDCDRVVFPGDFPTFPYGAPIVSFRQRWTGYQALPTQIFTTSGLPLRSVDFSGNSLRKLTEKLLQGLQASLVELRLADNLLGDTLNPIFSSSEFHGLTHLQLLDLSGNSIKAIEEGILEGCSNLQELYLDRNSLSSIPNSSLNGPKALKVLSLTDNRIGAIKRNAFQSQKTLERIDLRNNIIWAIEAGTFQGLDHLKFLLMSRNRLTRFNSDVFQGAENLQQLDLAENFITEFPNVALKAFSELRYLNLSSNLIQSLDNNDLSSLVGLYQLDLSRNNIANIVPGTFLGLKQLRKLDISVNALRTIEDDAFEGLDNLESLSLKDNNILLIPASALGRLPRLTSLQLEYNRVTALSGDILRSIAERVTKLVIAKNVVRELPAGTFQYFQQLEELDLTRNLLTTISSDTFSGTENSLKSLRLSQNRISTISGPPLALPKLKALDLSRNHLKELPKNVFNSLVSLQYLNVSKNVFLTSIPVDILHKLQNLKAIDLDYCRLQRLSADFLTKSTNLETFSASHNEITDIPNGAFVNLSNLTKVDLSFNRIDNIRAGAFVNVMNIKELILKGNSLTSFKGEFFNTGTGLEIIDISQNRISYLFPSSFRIHPRLRQIRAAKNKLSFFPADVIATLQYLNYIDLSDNQLKTVEELDFARLPRLRTLLLANNEIDNVSEMAFHNSTQLQVLDLSGNKLDRLGERTFEGLVRLEMLNLKDNVLNDLPETIFDRSRLQMLENIVLSRNAFEVAPLKSLQRQYFFVSSVDLSHNKIRDIPADDSIMVNIKKLDLSFNPLSEQAIANVLGEPKTVRELNLAGTGIDEVVRLETPFLNHLNLSYNNISSLTDHIFERTTLLETLDVSHNLLSESTTAFPKLWSVLHNIQSLNLSFNPIKMISQDDFDGLQSLRYFSIHNLDYCSRIEKAAFIALPNLSTLEAYGYPKLGYLDIQGILQYLPYLEHVNIETKDAAIGGDQLQSVLHPHLQELGVWGSRLRSISSGTLSGLKGENIIIRLRNTSITALPPTLFFPVPRSSQVVLDVTGNQLTTLSSQILSAHDDKRGDLQIIGLSTNPIVCDCNARALKRWLPPNMNSVRCSAPEHLGNKSLVSLDDDEFTCDPRKITSSTPSTMGTSSRTTRLVPKTTEPEIIWSLPSTEKTKPKTNSKLPTSGQSMTVNNDDTLIIGIVGGVVAFIAILIIVICIIRLRMTGNQYRGGPLANGVPVMTPPVMGAGSSCACSVKGGNAPYAVPSVYGAGYSATLPHKMTGPASPRAYSTMGRMPYYQNNSQPYFIAYSSDDKIYR